LTALKKLLLVACLVSFLGSAATSHAQANATSERVAIMQIGGGWSITNPDYAQRKVQGFSIYGDLDFKRHWGIEGDIHRTSIITPTHIGVDSYLLGPRYVYRRNRWNPYAKVLFGLGRFKYKFDNAPEAAYTYKIYAFGGGLDLYATKRINIRAIDFEYQKWPGYPTNGLTPLVYSFGAAYAF